jgi:hypothetical protein
MAKETPGAEQIILPSRIESIFIKRIAANIDVESIELNTKLGNCNLNIEARLRNDDAAQKLLGEYAMQYLIWHIVPAGAFNKKSEYKRDAKYSDGLAKHLRAEGIAILGRVFENVSIETSEYKAPDKIAKLIKQYIDLGFSEADAKAEAEKVQAKLASKNETKTDEESV